MASVIQATCPGCKKPLRIPSDWIHKPIRCKHCGMVMAAKRPAPAAPPAPAPQPQKPAPSTPIPPTAMKAIPVAMPAKPAAVPVAVVVAPAASPFADLEDSSTPTPRSSRRQTPSGGGWWKGPAIALTVLFLAGVAVSGLILAGVGKRLFLSSPSQQSARNDDKESDADKERDKDKKSADDKESSKPETDKSPDKKPGDKTDKTSDKTTDKKPGDKTDKTTGDKSDKTDKSTDKKPGDKTDKGTDKSTDPKPIPAGGFPRRALIISVHNYLYANPVGGRNIGLLATKLAAGLKIPTNQVAHLSDEAGGGKARPPVKQVIQQTLDDFLNTSRPQDRVLVFFVGHAVEIEGAAYLVPIEGEMSKPETLIDLKWVYEELKKCRAREKVLVLDVGRFNPTHGVERPGSFPVEDALYGPMTEKFDEAVKKTPPGVEVWTSCAAKEMSFENDAHPSGLFIDKLAAALDQNAAAAQRPEDTLPVAKLNEAVSAAMKPEAARFKVTQTPQLVGKAADGGADYDPKTPSPPDPKFAATTNNKDNVRIIQAVLGEISTPPVKGVHADAALKFDMMPPFNDKAMKSYGDDKSEKLEGAVNQARAMLWAISGEAPPKGLEAEVQAARGRLKGKTLALLKEGFKKPQNENQLKTEIMNHSRDVADILDEVRDAFKKLNDVEFDREKEPKRWVANYDFMVARMEEQIAYLFEYQSMLGQMRKELPPLEAPNNGWKLASVPSPSGDTEGKKKAKSAGKHLDEIAKAHEGTPWEVLAKREKLTTLGLEWRGAVLK
jgi:hypothetical protein